MTPPPPPLPPPPRPPRVAYGPGGNRAASSTVSTARCYLTVRPAAPYPLHLGRDPLAVCRHA
eukprot:5322471-Pyramimonas_sp.AAC.1